MVGQLLDNGTSGRWRQQGLKHIGVLVKQCDLVYERQCSKCWFNEDKTNMS